MWSAAPELPRDTYKFILQPQQLDIAKTYGAAPEIHVEDYVFLSMYDFNFSRNFGKAYEHYFLSGHTSAKNIRDLVVRHLGTDRMTARLRLLDFASGYGCVSRHLRRVFPNASVMAMDIHDHAYHFNRLHLGVETALSHVNPNHVDAVSASDVVFALSFLSHVPRDRQLPWLLKLWQFVAPGGLLIFTTHGETSHRQHMPHIPVDDCGYGFIAESEQFDLDTANYGHAVTYARYILANIAVLQDVHNFEFRDGLWFAHQDTFALTKRVIPLASRVPAVAP